MAFNFSSVFTPTTKAEQKKDKDTLKLIYLENQMSTSMR